MLPVLACSGCPHHRAGEDYVPKAFFRIGCQSANREPDLQNGRLRIAPEQRQGRAKLVLSGALFSAAAPLTYGYICNLLERRFC
jgi:hypothetical protein